VNHVFQRLILRAFSCCWLESLGVNGWSNYFSCRCAWPVKKQFMGFFSMSRPFVNGQEVGRSGTAEASNGSFPSWVLIYSRLWLKIIFIFLLWIYLFWFLIIQGPKANPITPNFGIEIFDILPKVYKTFTYFLHFTNF